MKLTITIDLNSDAFMPDPLPEVDRILDAIKKSIACTGIIAHDVGGYVTDRNGNAAANWIVNEDWPNEPESLTE